MNSDESDEDYVFSGDNEDEIYIVVDPVHLEVESLDDDSDSRLSDYNSSEGGGDFSDSSLEIEGKTVNVHKYIKGKRFRYGDNGKIELEKALLFLFDDVNHFRKVLREYAVQNCFRLVRNKNEKARVIAHCGSEGCNWRIRGTPLVDKVTYKIKTLGPDHTCVRVNKLKYVTSSTVTCSICNTVGHNKRGCQRAPTARAAREAATGPSRAACPSKATTSRGRVGVKCRWSWWQQWQKT
ncbi:uncharacterized protein LOC132306370 isoform X2 [Cornus florida]|uniref:uncharacterized protein LOC132306370 isoform X2 n=1 Tax=Cornus florida TaxID=4283 RepID=UPI00289F8794|nr:uncharacterized protein LOC132306370 isoform X2 [Cornus florida]XP_059659729.1 uncharacterized protein LOC132306370 isoform X2 [Cornus florida]